MKMMCVNFWERERINKIIINVRGASCFPSNSHFMQQKREVLTHLNTKRGRGMESKRKTLKTLSVISKKIKSIWWFA